MTRITRCVGTTAMPCPTSETWTYSGVGVPRKRCAACMTQTHLESGFMSYAVIDQGMSEEAAEIAMRLHFAKASVRRGDLVSAMRLTRAAMEALSAGGLRRVGGEGA